MRILIFLILLPVFSLQDHKSATLHQLRPYVGTMQPERLLLFDNPAQGRITLVYKAGLAGKGLISFYYLNGNLYGQKEVTMNKGVNTWYYSISRSFRGLLLVRLRSGSIDITEKFIRE